MRQRLLWSVLALLLLTGSGAEATSSSGSVVPLKAKLGPDRFHEYAVVLGPTTGGIQGLSVRRTDGVIVQPTAAALCPRTGGWVFVTQWLIMRGGWLELGTGHACTGETLTYVGHGDRTGWHWDATVRDDALRGPHVYALTHLAGRRWGGFVDGHLLGEISWSSTASALAAHAGLESYTAAATVTGASVTDLRTLRDGRWQPQPVPLRLSVDRHMAGVALPGGAGFVPGQAPTVLP